MYISLHGTAAYGLFVLGIKLLIAEAFVIYIGVISSQHTSEGKIDWRVFSIVVVVLDYERYM